MSKRIITDVLSLLRDGWKPYHGFIESFVYSQRPCGQTSQEQLLLTDSELIELSEQTFENKNKKKKADPFWFSKDNIFICLGCSKNCILDNPQGFQGFLLDMNTNNKNKVYISPYTPDELLNKRKFLKVHEVAYCLNISIRKVYQMVDFGEFLQIKRRPLRIAAEEVKEYLEQVEE